MSFRWGEMNEVISNRQRFLAQLNIEPKRVVSAELVHGEAIARVGQKQTGYGVLSNDNQINADGLITDEPNVYLFHAVADCLSILLYDPVKHAIGLAHAGWRGTTARLTEKIIACMADEFGTTPTDLIIGLGPALQSCCYVYQNPAQLSLPEWQPFLRVDMDKTHIDNVAFNIKQLERAGVPPRNIYRSEHCTVHTGMFPSHYADQQDKRPESRFATIIGLRE